MADPQRTEATDFEASPLSRAEYISAMVHLYRGEMHRALTWRQRLDTTTNWGVFTSGALLSFLYTDKNHESHVVGIMGMYLVFFMLCFEARRFRFFDVWRTRVRKLEENFYAPLLRRDLSSPVENWGFVVAEDLLTPRFKIGYLCAMRARLIRNYIPLFLVLFCAWVGKLILHPPEILRVTPAGSAWSPGEPFRSAESIGEAFLSAGMGPIPWWIILSLPIGLAIFLLGVGVLGRPRRSEEYTWWSHRSEESVDEVS
jgi:uncharacterized membrane protein